MIFLKFNYYYLIYVLSFCLVTFASGANENIFDYKDSQEGSYLKEDLEFLELDDPDTFLYEYDKNYKGSKNIISWNVFATTKSKEECDSSDGLEFCSLIPIYNDIKSYKNKEIIIYGFMFPLEQAEVQNKFLLGPYPLTCPFHYHTPTNLIVEISGKKGFSFDYEPIKIKGILDLKYNKDYEIFYYLKNAEKI